MKCNRAKEIIACCEGIIRNAEKIAEDIEYNQWLEITINIPHNEVPSVTISKGFMPKELIEHWKSGDVIE